MNDKKRNFKTSDRRKSISGLLITIKILIITPWSKALPKKLTGPSPFKKFLYLIEPECS
jgi:hypothetical protein